VFVDGDFWHGRLLVEGGARALEASLRTERRSWWVSKLTANVARDRRADSALVAMGWRVIRLWERDVLARTSAAADVVCAILHESSVCVGPDRRSHSDSSRPSLDSLFANCLAKR
jgi:G:T-mismatch repair DNA endonuclease (very short patch repair protein)